MAWDNEDEVTAAKFHQREILQEMQKKPTYTVPIPQRKNAFARIIKKIPMLSKFLHHLDNTGEAIIRVGEQVDFSHSSTENEQIHHGFHFGGVVLAAWDFIRIPVIYLTAYVLKEDVPINLNNNTRWFYAGLLLGLTITALALPVVAPFIGLAAAICSLVFSAFLMSKLIIEHYQLRREAKQLSRMLQLEENQMDKIQQEAAALEQLSSGASNEEHFTAIQLEIGGIQERYDRQKFRIEVLMGQQIQCAQNMRIMRFDVVFNRCVSLFLASLTLIGVVLALTMPPVGAMLLAGVALAGFALIAIKIGVFVTHSLSKRWASESTLVKSMNDKDREGSEEVPTERRVEGVHESTADVLVNLSGNKKISEMKWDESPDDEEPQQEAHQTPFLNESTPAFKPHSKAQKANPEDEADEEESESP